ncbi:PIF1 helicase, putative [Medicago truncatula]|uniref:PIF1 helicase, putative n=1 Tax=Medicago truncatula TaxID=3880 RepID=A0A072U871_MEDTR|nr:PIF1 helicase, putative [Medicago truncatula]
MTINKSQGKSLKHVGVYLPLPIFSYGQLYVALLRVTSREGLKILIYDDDGEHTDVTSSVVYHEVFPSSCHDPLTSSLMCSSMMIVPIRYLSLWLVAVQT